MAVGCVVMPSLNKKPPLNLINCVHKDFVQKSQPYVIGGGQDGFLWSSQGSGGKGGTCSVWTVANSPEGLNFNSFLLSDDLRPPPASQAYTLRQLWPV